MADYDLETYRSSVLHLQREKNKQQEEKSEEANRLKREQLEEQKYKNQIMQETSHKKLKIDQAKMEERKKEINKEYDFKLKQLEANKRMETHIHTTKLNFEREKHSQQLSHEKDISRRQIESQQLNNYANNLHDRQMKGLDFYHSELSKRSDLRVDQEKKRTDFSYTKKLKKLDNILELKKQAKEHLQQLKIKQIENKHALEMQEQERQTYTHQRNIDLQKNLIESREADKSFILRSEEETRAKIEIIEADIKKYEEQEIILTKELKERAEIEKSVITHKTVCDVVKMQFKTALDIKFAKETAKIKGSTQTQEQVDEYMRENIDDWANDV